MNQTITAAQLQRLQAEYGRIKRDGDPRAAGPDGVIHSEDRDGRLQWARDHLGTPRLKSFGDLDVKQAAYLLDILAGKPTKLDLLLRELLKRARILHPESWFKAIQAKRMFWYFKGARLDQLNRFQKWKLCELLEAREDEPAEVQGTLFDTSAASHSEARRACARGNH